VRVHGREVDVNRRRRRHWYSAMLNADLSEENESIHTIGAYGIDGRGLVESGRGCWVVVCGREECVGLGVGVGVHDTVRGAGGTQHRGERDA
jgi:hypothetical protein